MLEPDDEIDNALEGIGERIEAVAKNLQVTELLDSVCIIVTYQQGGKTARKTTLAGNYYASLGAVQSWIDEGDH